jgi:hypothetical protein
MRGFREGMRRAQRAVEQQAKDVLFQQRVSIHQIMGLSNIEWWWLLLPNVS